MNTDHENIELRKIGEPEPDSLPRGIKLIIVDRHTVFVRRVLGRFIPVTESEQEELHRKHIVS
jgi:hypothetical protein